MWIKQCILATRPQKGRPTVRGRKRACTNSASGTCLSALYTDGCIAAQHMGARKFHLFADKTPEYEHMRLSLRSTITSILYLAHWYLAKCGSLPGIKASLTEARWRTIKLNVSIPIRSQIVFNITTIHKVRRFVRKLSLLYEEESKPG